MEEAKAKAEQMHQDAERNLQGTLAQIKLKDEQFQEAQISMSQVQSMLYWETPDQKPPIDRFVVKRIGEEDLVFKRPKNDQGKPIGFIQQVMSLQQKLDMIEAENKKLKSECEDLKNKCSALEAEKAKWEAEEAQAKWKLAEIGQKIFDIWQKFEFTSKQRGPLDQLRDARGASTVMPASAVNASLTALLSELDDYVDKKTGQINLLVTQLNKTLDQERRAFAESERERLEIQGQLVQCEAELATKESAVSTATAEVRRSQELAATTVGTMRGSMGEELDRLRRELEESRAALEACESEKAGQAARISQLEADTAAKERELRDFQAETRRLSAESITSAVSAASMESAGRIAGLEERIRELEGQLETAGADIEADLQECRATLEAERAKVVPVPTLSPAQEAELSIAKSRASELEQELGRLRGEIAGRKEELAAMKRHETEITQSYEKALADLRAATEGLPAGKSVKDLVNRIAELEAALEQKETVSRRLSEASAKSEASMRSMQSVESELRAANSRLQAQVEVLTSQKAAAESKSAELETQISGLRGEIVSLSGERDAIQGKLAACEEERQSLRLKAAELAGLEAKLASQAGVLEEKELTLASQLEAKSGLEGQILKLTAERDDLKAAVRGLEDDLKAEKEISGQVDGLRTRLESQAAMLAAKEAELAGKENEAIAALEKQVRELTNALAKQQEECAAKLAAAESREGEAKRQAAEAARASIAAEWEAKYKELESKYKAQEARTREAIAAKTAELGELHKSLAATKAELERRPDVKPEQIPLPPSPIMVTPPSEVGLEAQVAELKEKLAAAEAERDALQKQLGKEVAKPESSESIKQTTESLGDKNAEIERLREALTNAEKDIDRITGLKDKNPATILQDYGILLKEKGTIERERNELRDALAAAQKKRISLAEAAVQVGSLEKASEDLSGQLADCKEKLGKAEDALREAEGKLAAAKADAGKVPGLTSEIASLRAKLEAAETAKKEAEGRVAEAQEAKGRAFTATTDKNAELLEETSKARRERDAARLEASGYKGDLAESKKKVVALEKERDKFKADYEAAAAELADARRELGEKSADVAGLEAGLAALREKEGLATEQQKRISSLEQEVERLKPQVESLTRERDRIKGELATKEGELAAALAESKRLGDELAAARRKIADMTASHSSALKSATEDKDAAVSSLEAQLRDIRAEKDRVDEALAALRAEKESIVASKADVEAELAALKSSSSTLQSNLDAALADAGSLRDQLNLEKEKVAAAEAEREDIRATMQATIDAKEAEILAIQGAQAALSQELEGVKAERDATQSALAEMKADCDAVKGERDSLSEQVTSLKAQLSSIEAAKAEAERLKGEAQTRATEQIEKAEGAIQARLDKLGETLKERDAELASVREELQDAQRENRRLAEEEKRLNEALAAAEGKIGDLKAEKTDIEQKAKEQEAGIRSELEAKRRELEAERQRAVDAELARDRFEAEVRRLESRVEELEGKLRETVAAGELKKAEKELAGVKDKLAAVEAELAAKKTECQDCKDTVARLEREAKDLERKIKHQGESALNVLKTWVSELRIILAGHGNAYKMLTDKDRPQGEDEDDTDYQRKRYKNALEVMGKLLDEAKATQSDLEALQRTKDGLEKDKEKLEKQLAAAETKAKSAEDARVALVSTTGAQKADLEAEIDRQKGLVKQKEEEIAKLKEEHEAALSALQRQYDELKAEKEELERTGGKTAGDLQATLAEKEAALKVEAGKVAALEKEKARIEKDRDAAKERVAELEGQLSAAQSGASESAQAEIAALGAALRKKEGELGAELAVAREELRQKEEEADKLKASLTNISNTLSKVKGTSPEEKAINLVKDYEESQEKLAKIREELEKLTTSKTDIMDMIKQLGEDLAAAKANADEFEGKFNECAAERRTQATELEGLRAKEAAAAKAAAEAEAALAEQQRRAKEAEDQRVLEQCNASKSELESIIKAIDEVLRSADRVPPKKINILKTQKPKDVATFNQFLQSVKGKLGEVQDCKPDVSVTQAIQQRLDKTKPLYRQLDDIRRIIQAAQEAVEGIDINELCEEKFEELTNKINNYIGERNSLAKKLVTSIQERIINLGIAAGNAPPDEATRLRQLQKTRLNYLSVVENRPQEYSEGIAQKAQGVYQSVADKTETMMTTAKGALEGYGVLYKSIEQYLKPGAKVPRGVDIKGINAQFAGFCRTFDTILRQIDGLKTEPGFITNERLINDFEDISGTVRVYARINDRFVRNATRDNMSVYVVSDDRGNCTRNIVFKGGKKCTGEEFTPETYENFYSVFMCADNVHMYKGITLAVEEKNPLLCGNDQKPPSKDMCVFTDDSSRGLRTTIKQVFDGYSVVLQVYGFSGSGKTYTLFGSAKRELPGVVQLAFKDPTIAGNIETLEITGITELYGQGSLAGGDYPKRVERRAAGPGVVGRVNYIDSFYQIQQQELDAVAARKPAPQLYAGVKFSDLMSVTGREGKRTINIRTDNVTNIGRAIDFINEKITLDRRINGGIKATPNNPESSRGHLFIKFKITPKTGQAGELIVVDSGGIENPIDIIRIFFSEVPRKNAIGALPRKEQGAAVFGSLVSKQAGFGEGESLQKIKTRTKFGRQAMDEIAEYRKDYSSNIAANFANEDSYVLIRQLKYMGEDLTQRIYGDIGGMGFTKLMGNVQNNNKEFADMIKSAELINFVQKYGLNLQEVQKDMIALKMRFDSGFRAPMSGDQIGRYGGPDDDDFLLYKLKVARDIVREGFFINETLNEMKDYFRHQQREYENWKLPQDKDKIWNNLNGDFPSGGKKYNEFDVFYMPYFEGEDLKKLWLQGKSKGEVASYTFDYSDLVGNKGDPTGMLTQLDKIAKEGQERQKPSKFVLIALVRPDLEVEVDDRLEDTTKYCIGAKAALKFAAKIASTKKIGN